MPWRPMIVAPVGKSGALDELHQVAGRGLGVVEVVHDAVDHLAEVVRRDVGGHADRDAAGAVHEQVREPRRAARPAAARTRRSSARSRPSPSRCRAAAPSPWARGAPRCTGRRRRVAVDRAEVAVAVDERVAQRPVLGHADERVVDRLVAVRVVLLQHVADHGRALAVRAVGPVARPRASPTGSACGPASGRHGRRAARGPR